MALLNKPEKFLEKGESKLVGIEREAEAGKKGNPRDVNSECRQNRKSHLDGKTIKSFG